MIDLQPCHGPHRFLEKIERALSMGKRHFVLEGNIHDWFYTPYIGSASLLRTLRNGLLLQRHLKIRRVLQLADTHGTAERGSPVTCYLRPGWCEAEGLIFSRSRCQHFEHALTGVAGGSTELLPGKRESAETVVQSGDSVTTAAAAGSAYRECLDSLPVLAGEATQDVAFVITDFAAAAGLYPTAGQDAGVYAKALDAIWRQEKDLLTFLIVDETTALREQFFPQLEERVELITIGRPGIAEIHCATRRREQDAVSCAEGYRVLATVLHHERSTLKESLHLFSGLERELLQQPEQLRTRLNQILDVRLDYHSWNDVVVSEATRHEIQRILVEFQNAVRQRRAPSTSGILFHGPPGTGKTLLARVIAAEAGMSFFPLTLSDTKAEYVGQTSARIRRIFEDAAAAAPAVIFVDEIDGILPARGDRSMADSFTRDAVNEFLPRLDGVDSRSQGVLLIGATNRMDLIDSAAISRLTPLEIHLPGSTQRREIFLRELGLAGVGQISAGCNELLESLAERSQGMAGRDIRRIAGSILHNVQRRWHAGGGNQKIAVTLASLDSPRCNELSTDAFREAADSVRCLLRSYVFFQQPAAEALLPADLMQSFQSGVVEFLRLRDMESEYVRHKLPPVNRLLLKGVSQQRSSRLLSHIAASAGCELLMLTDLPRATGDELEALIENLNQLAIYSDLIVHPAEMESFDLQQLELVWHLMQRLSGRITVVAFAGERTEQLERLFDQVITLPDRYQREELQRLMRWLMEQMPAVCEISDQTIVGVVRQWSARSVPIGLVEMESELNQALRTAVGSGFSDRQKITLHRPHFRTVDNR